MCLVVQILSHIDGLRPAGRLVFVGGLVEHRVLSAVAVNLPDVSVLRLSIKNDWQLTWRHGIRD